MSWSVPAVVAFFRRWQNLCLFVGGFLFDFITIRRADSWADIGLQVFFLAGLAGLMILQHREHLGRWSPRSERVAKAWRYNVDVLHFFYGGLLSNYAVIYFMSSSGARPVIFIFFLAALMIMNEMPQIRRFGHRLRLGLYAFCMSSFMIYFLPIFVGFMNTPIFLLSLIASGWLVWRLAARLADGAADPRAEQRRLFVPAGAVIAAILLLQWFHLIPPVPLSVRAQGVYHGVERSGDGFRLRAAKPHWTRFWRRDSRPFQAGDGDRIYFFVRVFAPARFRANLKIRWEQYDEGAKKWVTSDRIPLNIVGGRDEGFRGYAVKSNFTPGRWRVWTETEDGRPVGVLPFAVVPQPPGERRWIETRM